MSLGEHADDHAHSHTHTADAWLSAHDLRINRDPIDCHLPTASVLDFISHAPEAQENDC
jgi:hypothetical protein